MPVTCVHQCTEGSRMRCSGCGGGPCVHCGGGGGGSALGRVERSLVMERCTWERMKRRAGPEALLDARPAPDMPPPRQNMCGCAPTADEHARRVREDARRLRLTMNNVAQKEGLYARLVAKRGERTRMQAERRERLLAAASEERAAERKEFIDGCRRLLRATNTQGVRQLDSALRFTEVLRERKAQVAFNERLRQEALQRQQTWNEHLRKIWARQDELQELRARDRQTDRQEYKAQLLKQLQENASYRLEEKREIERERNELDLMHREAANAEKRSKELAAKRKQEMRRMLSESIADQQRLRERLANENKEEDRVIEVTRDVQYKMRRTGMRKIKERVNAFMTASEKMAENIWEAHRAGVRKMEEDDEKIRKIQKESERRWRQREEEEAQRRAFNIAAQKQSFREYQQSERERCVAEERERARLLALHERQREMVKSLHQEELDTIKRKQKEARANYDRQCAEKREQNRKEHEEEMKMYMDKLNTWKSEDAHFFEYANQLLQEAQCKGRLPLPFHKVIYNYKKTYGLLPRPVRVNTLKSPNCW